MILNNREAGDSTLKHHFFGAGSVAGVKAGRKSTPRTYAACVGKYRAGSSQ